MLSKYTYHSAFEALNKNMKISKNGQFSFFIWVFKTKKFQVPSILNEIYLINSIRKHKKEQLQYLQNKITEKI